MTRDEFAKGLRALRDAKFHRPTATTFISDDMLALMVKSYWPVVSDAPLGVLEAAIVDAVAQPFPDVRQVVSACDEAARDVRRVRRKREDEAERARERAREDAMTPAEKADRKAKLDEILKQSRKLFRSGS